MRIIVILFRFLRALFIVRPRKMHDQLSAKRVIPIEIWCNLMMMIEIHDYSRAVNRTTMTVYATLRLSYSRVIMQER